MQCKTSQRTRSAEPETRVAEHEGRRHCKTIGMCAFGGIFAGFPLIIALVIDCGETMLLWLLVICGVPAGCWVCCSKKMASDQEKPTGQLEKVNEQAMTMAMTGPLDSMSASHLLTDPCTVLDLAHPPNTMSFRCLAAMNPAMMMQGMQQPGMMMQPGTMMQQPGMATATAMPQPGMATATAMPMQPMATATAMPMQPAVATATAMPVVATATVVPPGL